MIYSEVKPIFSQNLWENMPKILLLLCLLSHSIYPRIPEGINNNSAIPQQIDSVITNVLNEISTDSITAYIQGLQDFGTRYLFAENRDSVSDWIKAKFEGFGYSNVRLDSFQYEGTWQRNVEATLESGNGSDNVIVIGGHYDCHTLASPFENAPGADDNASGTAAVLEIARVLKKTGYKPSASFRFVAFAAEELGLFGSTHYAKDAVQAGTKIKLMINHDMISYCKKSLSESAVMIKYINPNSKDYSFARMSQGLVNEFSILDTARVTRTAGRSDSESFSSEGFPAIWFQEEVFSPHYHLISDLVSNHNMLYCTEVIKLSGATLIYSDNLPDDVVNTKIFDEGTGSSLFISWESNSDYHHVYVGKEPGIYDTVHLIKGKSLSVRGLSTGIEYFIGIAGYSPLGLDGLVKELSCTPTRVPAMPEHITDIPKSEYIKLTWGKNRELDVIGYNIYRSEDSSGSVQKIAAVRDTFYVDQNTESIYYYYQVRAADSTGLESISASIRSRVTGLNAGILLVNETSGESGPLSPTDAETDSFFTEILRNYKTSTYDLSKEKLIKLADIGAYSTIIWCSNSVNTNSALNKIQEDLKAYLDLGGNFIFNGYLPVESFYGGKPAERRFQPGEFIYDYLKIAEYEKERAPRFLSAKSLSEDYRSVFVDSNKSSAENGYHLLNIEVLSAAPGAENIFSFESSYGPFTTEGYFNGRYVGVENFKSKGRTLILSFPLFYMKKNDTKALMETVLRKLNEASNPDDPVVVSSYKLMQNYPNPFNSFTTIEYEIPEPSQVNLKIYNALGRETATVVNEYKNAGRYSIKYNSSGLSSGVYFYRLTAGSSILSEKMIILK